MAWRGWLRAVGVVAALFVGVVLHGAEFFVADGIRSPEQPASATVRSEPVGVVPSVEVVRQVEHVAHPFGEPALAGVALAVATAVVLWSLVRVDRQVAPPGRCSAARGRRAPPASSPI